jgi:hypothetical protein
MNFPENATKKDKIFLKKLWIDTLTGNLKDYEKTVKDFEAQIEASKKIVAENKDRIKRTKLAIKDAEDTEVD